ncbi:uncharacterized protein Z520_11499 [Fonsecaea multimorphosa CBS 102226]|uniref:Borealin N-terminal domain-containing protein n=1 Tax=Fonsecaea multimorphosa CBS 102226 TaxID=1442371 RepID=A0A0D2I6J5_9EURO|nr:uncharacterized protein Z520_11499 [Fonsecaea multimorphosa CBS 102226]KIX92836.1 hypothetical protein Z520_11499 [Fonsecaea multimorphosa CBS 102226]OAL18084.1 hypothetical protein AYO22_11006 [Fonsecaea multimorphosa]
MAPANSRKRKSDEMDDLAGGAVTPSGSPARKKLRITQQQKQALMDNLQLEITERARQLRAGYALQCADLRARIERRVNRIPLSIRKMTMRELMEQHESSNAAKHQHQQQPRAPTPKHTISVQVPAQPKPLPPLPRESGTTTTTKLPSPVRSQQPQASATRGGGKKRMSPVIQIAMDKVSEHDPSEAATLDTLPVVKNTKRGAKGTAAAPTTRPTSRAAGKHTQISVLSPRSHNSRTLPRSPIKDPSYLPTSPVKTNMLMRPTATTAMSPIRPTSPLKSAATAATSAISASVHGMIEQAKRGGTATAAKLTRTASKEKKEAAAMAKAQMLPPPKPSAPPVSPQRAFSQASTHSTLTDVSAASSSTTVVKPKRGGRAATATAKATTTTQSKDLAAAATDKKKGGMARAASAAKTALKRNANATAGAAGATNKRVVVAEPAAGRRVLRKRA